MLLKFLETLNTSIGNLHFKLSDYCVTLLDGNLEILYCFRQSESVLIQ